ncbi:MAG TPA: 3'-5' exoribonuclease [Nitrospiraceae bacterium]|nr:3'-5' exoribonuclease [Nitrospiraceae bacterium]
MLDIMLDLETMGNGPQAAIIAIGAVEFDIPTQAIGERFYQVVDLASSIESGGVMDASTVLWWMRQSDEARSAFDRESARLPLALVWFSKWLSLTGPKEDLRVWGNGAAFDNVVLSSAYRRLGLEQPWSYKGDRCYRTIKSLHPDIPVEPIGTAHNAADDAESQARHLIKILSKTV